jgi:hypothetical protein
MESTFAVQAELTVSAVEDAVNAGRVVDVGSLQAFLGRPAFKAALTDAIQRHTVAATGMTVDEIDAATQTPEFAGDPAFGAALGEIATNGQALLERAQAAVMQMVEPGAG